MRQRPCTTIGYHTNQQFREPEVVALGLQQRRDYLVTIVTNANAIAYAEQSAGLRVTAPDGDRWVRAMRCLIFIQFARSIWILAWSDESRPGRPVAAPSSAAPLAILSAAARYSVVEPHCTRLEVRPRFPSCAKVPWTATSCRRRGTQQQQNDRRDGPESV